MAKDYIMRRLNYGCNMTLVIDSIRFTHEKEAVQGTLPAASFSRLLDSLASHEGEIAYHVRGDVDALSRPILALELVGELKILCQRCLSAMPFAVEIATTLTLFASEEAIDAAQEEDPDIEGILYAAKLDLAALIEDELILALPYAAKHDMCDDGERIAADKTSPFAVLASLKTRSAS